MHTQKHQCAYPQLQSCSGINLKLIRNIYNNPLIITKWHCYGFHYHLRWLKLSKWLYIMPLPVDMTYCIPGYCIVDRTNQHIVTLATLMIIWYMRGKIWECLDDTILLWQVSGAEVGNTIIWHRETQRIRVATIHKPKSVRLYQCVNIIWSFVCSPMRNWMLDCYQKYPSKAHFPINLQLNLLIWCLWISVTLLLRLSDLKVAMLCFYFILIIT